MAKAREPMGISFSVKLNLDGSASEDSGKSLEELAIEQNPDRPEEEIRTAVSNTALTVYKMIFSEDYERLKDQTYDEMPDQDKEKWPLIRLLFSDEISAEGEARFAKLMAESEAREQREQSAKKKVNKEIAIADSLSEPIFMLNLPDEHLVKLTDAGFTSVGQILFSIKVGRESILDAYLVEGDEAKSKKMIEYMKVTEHSLSEIVGATGYALIGSRLLQYNYVTRSEFLDVFRSGV